MKIRSIVLAALMLSATGYAVWNLTAGTGFCPYAPKSDPLTAEPPAEQKRIPVLVELFTSEGCSSCPPADRQLAFMQANQTTPGAEVVTLAYHVDYWDRLGWKDRFSSSQFSERQEWYTAAKGLDSNYTPQMIVDGEAQFVGSDARKADAAVSEAVRSEKSLVSIADDNDKLRITIGGLRPGNKAIVFLATAEDGLETDVKAGENGGRKLTHAAVVRDLKMIGTIDPAAESFDTTVVPPMNNAWKSENLRYVVFAQEEKTGKVIAVGWKSAAAN